MATYTTTTKWLLRKITGSSNRSEIDDGIAALADDIDARMAGYDEGTLAAIPGAGKAGRFYRTTDTHQVFMDTGSAWIEIGVSPWNPGDLKASWLTTASTGWLVCDGAAVSRATYAVLFAAIGASAGAGDGSTTFNVPDYRGRTFVMPDGSAGRMASNDSRGLSGGAERVTLTSAQSGMPAHSHAPNGPLSFLGSVGAAPAALFQLGGTYGFQSPTTTANAGPFDAGQSHENMGPYLVGGSVLIKT